jgi:rRNA-processing protein FCF1
MRVLLDTNIFIYREDDKVVSRNLLTLLRTLSKIKVEILIHPSSIDDLKRDKNVERLEIILSKVRSYCSLESPPDPTRDPDYFDRVNWKEQDDENEIIDNTILYAVYKDAVDFLITEDRGIHKKAKNLGIDDRVLLIDDALEIFERSVPITKITSPPPLKEDFVYNLNINDPIFTSLKKNYPLFENWFKKISREGRKCWAYYREDDSIGALLIYKIEDEPIASNPPLLKKRRLKLSTFIVTHVGHKIGELFIKLSIDFAVQNEISEIYLTHFTEPDDKLVQLITEYGFYKVRVNEIGEDIFVKELVTPEGFEYKHPIVVAKRFYPSFYDGIRVKKFVIPIQPKYHDRLFTDFSGRQTTITEHTGVFIVEGNTIKKAYLTHSRIKKMRTGDIILFYRSQDQSEITSLGIIESVYTRIQNPNKIIRLVGKRSVYTKEEIEEFANKPTTVILFLHHFHLKNPLHLDELKEMGVLAGAPQTAVEIDNNSYNKIKTRGGIDERFIVH